MTRIQGQLVSPQINPNAISFSPDPPQDGKPLTVTYTGIPGQTVDMFICGHSNGWYTDQCNSLNYPGVVVGQDGKVTVQLPVEKGDINLEVSTGTTDLAYKYLYAPDPPVNVARNFLILALLFVVPVYIVWKLDKKFHRST